MTDSVDSYIKNIMIGNIDFEDGKSFDDIFLDALHNAYNNYDDSWIDYAEPSLKEFMIIQHPCINYLEECGELEEITDAKRDWKWWYNIYALSREWCGDMEKLKEECFINIYERYIIELQSNIRRRQATIKTIRKLHLTGTL